MPLSSSPTLRLNEQFAERRAALRAFGLAILALAPLLLVYWTTPYQLASVEFFNIANSTFPLYFISVTAYLGYRMAKGMNGAIWTPLVWFPVQSSVFYGFGPLVLIYGNQITRASVADSFLYVTPEQLFRAHQLSTTGITIVFVGIMLHIYFSRTTWSTDSQRISPAIDPYKLGLLFVVVGGVFKYLILKPSTWEQIDILVPGFLANAGNLVDLGFAVVAFCAARGHISARRVIMVLLPIHFLLAALSLEKSEIILALLLPAIGGYVGHWNAKRLFIHLIAIGAIFVVSQPYVSYGRGEIFDATGSIQQAGYIDRVEILIRYAFDDQEAASSFEDRDIRQGWWTRLNYAGPQARVMELYDNGFANPMIHEAWIYFIPRMIWPEKPVIYAPGLELYRLLTGHLDGYSFLGLSIYGDLYWQYGWSGVIFGCLIVGWVLGIATARSINAIRRQEYLMLPFILLVLKTSMLGPNQFVISAFIGAVPIIVFWFFALWVASRVVRSQKKYGDIH